MRPPACLRASKRVSPSSCMYRQQGSGLRVQWSGVEVGEVPRVRPWACRGAFSAPRRLLKTNLGTLETRKRRSIS
jgi:hypothetical protein